MKRAYISIFIIGILIAGSITNYNLLKNISNDIKNELVLPSGEDEMKSFSSAHELFKKKHSYLCAVTYHSEIDNLRTAFVRGETYLELGDYDDYRAEKAVLLSVLDHIKENERFIPGNIF